MHAIQQLYLIFKLTVLFIPLLVIQFCGIDIEDSTPPSPPQWVLKSSPIEWPEHGIDADESGGISLEWLQNIESDIYAYQLYRAEWFDIIDSLGDYTRIKVIKDETSLVTCTIDQRVSLRTKYYYKLKAVDLVGNESIFSDSISYSIIPQISISSMSPNGITNALNENRTLSWRFPYVAELQEYTLTILTEQNQLIWRQQLQPSTYTHDFESFSIPDAAEILQGSIYSWRIDMGANFVGRIEYSGSESAWATFVVN